MNVNQVSTTCAIAGGGPAGAVLAYLLARNNVDVTLLEAHHDFDRDFRGDTLHPSTLEVMNELGLADRLLQLPHTKLGNARAQTQTGQLNAFDFSRIHTKFPYIALMPQARFLKFITDEVKRFPNFHLVMGAHVDGLIEQDGSIHGVRFQIAGVAQECRATLTVGADGRFSTLRKLSGLGKDAIKASPPMDILWFRISRHPNEPHGIAGRFRSGTLIIQLERETQWQIGLVIAKGAYNQLRAAGIDALRNAVARTAPELAERMSEITDWHQAALLSVEADRLPLWHKPGLLLIGDAAHVMSPAGGNGINYAIMDAVATANLLSAPLQTGYVTDDDLARVQRRRERPTRMIQAIVNLIQERVLRPALDGKRDFQPPAVMRWPVVGNLAARVMGFGIGREHVRSRSSL
jgi:2-polyprenyl-6-methoxyphenol hydroxylase-like FAD-dependent oxidoreductase